MNRISLIIAASAVLLMGTNAVAGSVQFDNKTGQTIYVSINGDTSQGKPIPSSGLNLNNVTISGFCFATGNTPNCVARFSFTAPVNSCSSSTPCLGQATFNAKLTETDFVSLQLFNKHTATINGSPNPAPNVNITNVSIIS